MTIYSVEFPIVHRCKRCRKKILKNKMARGNYVCYQPYCSFHCQEWARLEDASPEVAAMPEFMK